MNRHSGRELHTGRNRRTCHGRRAASTAAVVLGCTLVAGLLLTAAGCAPSTRPIGDTGAPGALNVVAAETFLADIAQNVAGDTLHVDALMPTGVDPHSFEPTPADVARVADADVLIANGAGFEGFLQEMLQNAGGQRIVIEASSGLVSRTAREGEATAAGEAGPAGGDGSTAGGGVATPDAAAQRDQGDPHFWLDPTLVVTYVENIRDGLSQADPTHAPAYAANASAYIDRLRALDDWIAQQADQIPPERRLLVTNHESLGYFADRYGFQVVGTVMPSVGTGVAPSPQQLARLAETITQTGVRAVFLETGANAQLADQLASETEVTVVSDIYTHSITGPDGPAPTYIDMMRANTDAIVAALK